MRKEEVKLSLFADDKILFLENPKDSIKNPLEVINSMKLQDTKLIQRSVVCLYTNNELPEKEIRKTILFTIAPKRIKYLEINLRR